MLSTSIKPCSHQDTKRKYFPGPVDEEGNSPVALPNNNGAGASEDGHGVLPNKSEKEKEKAKLQKPAIKQTLYNVLVGVAGSSERFMDVDELISPQKIQDCPTFQAACTSCIFLKGLCQFLISKLFNLLPIGAYYKALKCVEIDVFAKKAVITTSTNDIKKYSFPFVGTVSHKKSAQGYPMLNVILGGLRFPLYINGDKVNTLAADCPVIAWMIDTVDKEEDANVIVESDILTWELPISLQSNTHYYNDDATEKEEAGEKAETENSDLESHEEKDDEEMTEKKAETKKDKETKTMTETSEKAETKKGKETKTNNDAEMVEEFEEARKNETETKMTEEDNMKKKKTVESVEVLVWRARLKAPQCLLFRF